MEENQSDIIYPYVIDEQRFGPRDIIFREGDEGGWMFVILEGKIAVKKQSPRGLVKVAVLREGDILGESGFLTAGASRRSITAQAEGHAVLGVLDPDRMSFEFSSLPPKIRAILGGLSRRLRRTTRDAAALVR